MNAEHTDDGKYCDVSGKVKYPGRGSARRAVLILNRVRKGGSERLHPYRCPDCHAWHVGHGSR